MIKKELIVAKDPRAPISESFRALRTNLQFMNSSDDDNQIILVTSTFPGEGKTWVSSNIAVAYAQAGKKTCIVDVDLRKGRVYTVFNASPTPGVSNYLTGVNVNKENMNIAHFMQETELPNLYVIPAGNIIHNWIFWLKPGNIPPNPSELLISPKMKKMLNELKNTVDVIILDGTPCELVTDATIVSRIVDQTLIVAAHNSTKMEELKRTEKAIENAGGKVTGVILNKVPVSSRKYGEKYYYGNKRK